MHMYIKRLCSLAGIFLALLFLPLSTKAGVDIAFSAGLPVSNVAADTLEWPRPRFDERRDERHQMVEEKIEANGITDEKTLEAMRHVPRHLFVPTHLRPFAYQNRPLPIGHGQTISQPYIVAYMTQALNLKAGDKVLEIGTGSGYQAAILSELTPHVYTIEIVEELARETRSLLTDLGYTTIETKIGDGYKGWKKHAPFDAIILTAAPEEIPPPLIRQLKPDGIMIIPIGATGTAQELIKVTKTGEDDIHKEKLLPVRFVPMTGDTQEKN